MRSISSNSHWRWLMAVTTGIATLSVGLTVANAADDNGYTGTFSLLTNADASKARLDPDTNEVELGMRFRVARSGTLDGVKFLKAPGDVTSRQVSLWAPNGKLIASKKTTSESASGWQIVRFDSTHLDRGSYTVSYHARKYMATPGFFKQAVRSGPLTAPTGRNGVYEYSSQSVRPAKSYQSSNYWIDVAFTTKGRSSGGASSTTTSTTKKPSTTTTTYRPSTTTTSTTVKSTSTTVTAPTTSTTTKPPTPGTGGTLNLPHEAWDGGPAFYNKFTKASQSGWSNPNFFPISVFLSKPSQAPQLKALGVNTYMGAEHDGSPVSMMTSQGMYVIAQDEWTQAELGNDPRVVGHLVSDECDMGLGCNGGNAAGDLKQQQQSVTALRARNDGRFVQANYGNGVLGTYWAIGTFADLVQVVDVSSVDKYAYTSTHVQSLMPSSPAWPAGAKVASSGSYGWLQDRMESYMNPSALHPNWVFVEIAKPYLSEDGATKIQPNQFEGAVWSSIIHGARGLAYFQHNNDPSCGNYALIDCDQAIKDKVKTVNAQVQRMAPVLNTQSYVWNFNSGTDTMLKTSGDSAYVFAGIGLNQTPGTKTFTLPAGIKGTTVTVVDENRTIPVTNGKFTDALASESTHHIYKVNL